jgi:adenylosuccinate synthase
MLYNFMFEKFYKVDVLDTSEIYKDLLVLGEKIRPLMTNTHKELNEHYRSGKKLVLEGAQGVLLDIDHGTYPFVTSSNVTTGGVFTGTGLPPQSIDRVLGITKAYTTRVGSGPFPTEMPEGDPIGDLIQDIGKEFGATTGRRRSCGWLDLVSLKYAIETNGVTDICLTKMDVLDTLNKIKVCVAYKTKNEGLITHFPSISEDFDELDPIYETLEGWKSNTFGVNDYSKLPEKALSYIKFIEDFVGVKVTIISTGPDRKHTIKLKDFFI